MAKEKPPVRKRISKLAAMIGLAVALVVIGGSVVGGIALAMDHGRGAPASVSDSTPTGNGAVAPGQDGASADDQNGDGQSDEGSQPGGNATDSADDCDSDEAADDADDADDEATEDDAVETGDDCSMPSDDRSAGETEPDDD